MKKILITFCLFNTVACGAFSPIEDGEYSLASIEVGGVRKTPTAAQSLTGFTVQDGIVMDKTLDEAGANEGSPTVSSSGPTEWTCGESAVGEMRPLIRGLLAAGVTMIKPALRVACPDEEEGSDGAIVMFDRESDVQLVFARRAEDLVTTGATTQQSLSSSRRASLFRPFVLLK